MSDMVFAVVVAVVFKVSPICRSCVDSASLSAQRTLFIMKNGLGDYFVFCREYCAKLKIF